MFEFNDLAPDVQQKLMRLTISVYANLDLTPDDREVRLIIEAAIRTYYNHAEDYIDAAEEVLYTPNKVAFD